MTDIEKRVQKVRDAVSEASEGLKGKEYRQFLETLLSDAEGWKMELEELDD